MKPMIMDYAANLWIGRSVSLLRFPECEGGVVFSVGLAEAYSSIGFCHLKL